MSLKCLYKKTLKNFVFFSCCCFLFVCLFYFSRLLFALWIDECTSKQAFFLQPRRQLRILENLFFSSVTRKKCIHSSLSMSILNLLTGGHAGTVPKSNENQTSFVSVKSLKKKHVSQYRKLQEIKQESKPDSKTISNRPHLRNRPRKAVN